jgi:small-conductance mechanosensitive channel
VDPTKLLRNVLKGVKGAAQSTTQAFGNIATEIVGSSVLQPNSPQAIVAQSLTSANKTRLLARRLFYSFRKNGSDVMLISDIEEYFNSREEALDAFSMFDRDGNGDATREEMELACMDLHRERLALASSMRDIDSAVGRLDNILMTIYVAVAGIVFAVTLDAAVSTLLSGAAAFVLALSWLIGSSMQEILASIIFLFVKVRFLSLSRV